MFNSIVQCKHSDDDSISFQMNIYIQHSQIRSCASEQHHKPSFIGPEKIRKKTSERERDRKGEKESNKRLDDIVYKFIFIVFLQIANLFSYRRAIQVIYLFYFLCTHFYVRTAYGVRMYFVYTIYFLI